jgi:hypothetical protein
MQMASTVLLLAQLRELTRRLGATADDLARWREDGDETIEETLEIGGQPLERVARPSLEELAGFGLAVFLELAERAVEHRLPLKLDY